MRAACHTPHHHRAEASCELTQKSGAESELQLSKGIFSATLKSDDNQTVEVSVKDTVAGIKGGVSFKANQTKSELKYEASANAAYELLVSDALKLQAGAKVKAAPAKVKPEASFAALTSFADFFVKWDGAATTNVLFPVPAALFGYNFSLANETKLTKEFAVDKSSVIVQARQSKDLLFAVKLADVLSEKPVPSVSVVLTHKPVADEKVNITASWTKTSKGHGFGLFASRA